MSELEKLDAEQHLEWLKMKKALVDQGDVQTLAGVTLKELADKAKTQNS